MVYLSADRALSLSYDILGMGGEGLGTCQTMVSCSMGSDTAAALLYLSLIHIYSYLPYFTLYKFVKSANDVIAAVDVTCLLYTSHTTIDHVTNVVHIGSITQ